MLPIVITLEIFCIGYIWFDRKSLFYDKPKYLKGYILLWAFSTLFCVFYAFGWDYLLYQKLLSSRSDHLEPFYQWLYKFVGKDYVAWRFAVWGLSSIFMVLTFRNLKCDMRLASALFIILPLVQVYYVTRNTLGLSILFYALSLLNGQKRNFIPAIIWLYICTFFHTSMPMYVGVLALVLIIPINKISFYVSIAAFPVLKGVVLLVSNHILQGADNADFAARGVSYVDSDNEMQYTTIGWIHLAIQMLPVLYIMFQGIRSALKKRGLSLMENRFLVYSYILIYMSFLFWGEASKHLQTRFWDASFMPLAFFLAMYLFPRRNTKAVRVFIVWELFVFAWRLLYNIYSFDATIGRIL